MDKKTSLQLEHLTKHFESDSRLIVLTGAGISAESGIPTFRGKGGLWEKYDPAKVATAEALRLRPKAVWAMHDELRQTIARCKPNSGHTAIAELERIFKNFIVITQNVDNYHQDAGSKNVLEMHGNAWRVKCTAEDKSWVDKTVPYEQLPPVCSCGAPLRPDVVFFNEPLDQEVLNQAFFESSRANIMLVVGTSYTVYPAAYLPMLTKQSGGLIIEFNLEPTPITTIANVSVFGKSGIILPKFVEILKSKIGPK
ncbi:SIR2 family NAD-dependent protein deacylase [[Eubacterium] cellulosolvens]